ncbi:hypothetical protein SteCoe_13634 [Stentor coeruleus]|uniref:Uncharacterized protein n=1 Tax=Stentor coeruleus TaxID=5963 RepID=A0A1R2C820_9CILI|nr:hypothetical protein SteCoe_13634 [Stentor coeruleus]
MFKEKETWAFKRHLSPEPFTDKIDKLNLLQENLSIAAETIIALKRERDSLKESLKSALDESKYKEKIQELENSRSSIRSFNHGDLSKLALKEELQNLKKIATEKDKIIENMEKKFSNNKSEKLEFRTLNEKYNTLKDEMLEKERYIQMLEKKVTDFKNEYDGRFYGENIQDLKLELKEKALELESQTSQIKDLMLEKNQWKKNYDLLSGLLPEYLENGKSDWQNFREMLLSLRKSIKEKDLVIDNLNRKLKDTMSKTERKNWEHTRTTPNYMMKSDLESVDHNKKPSECTFLLPEIKNTVNEVIDKVHSCSQIHSFYKTHFLSTKNFKSMIENHEFPESLLKFMKLLIDIIDNCLNNSMMSTKNLYTTETLKRNYKNTIKGEKDENYGKFNKYDTGKSSRYKSEEKIHTEYIKSSNNDKPKISSWTQTPSDKAVVNKIIKPTLQLNNFNEDRSIQTSFDVQKIVSPKVFTQIPENKQNFSNFSTPKTQFIPPTEDTSHFPQQYSYETNETSLNYFYQKNKPNYVKIQDDDYENQQKHKLEPGQEYYFCQEKEYNYDNQKNCGPEKVYGNHIRENKVDSYDEPSLRSKKEFIYADEPRKNFNQERPPRRAGQEIFYKGFPKKMTNEGSYESGQRRFGSQEGSYERVTNNQEREYDSIKCPGNEEPSYGEQLKNYSSKDDYYLIKKSQEINEPYYTQQTPYYENSLKKQNYKPYSSTPKAVLNPDYYNNGEHQDFSGQKKIYENPHKKFTYPDSPYETYPSSITANDSNFNEKLLPEVYSPKSIPKNHMDLTLFDESHQLLKIIDKQNSRLEKINSQISQLVPSKTETISEREDFDESSNMVNYAKNKKNPKSINRRNLDDDDDNSEGKKNSNFYDRDIRNAYKKSPNPKDKILDNKTRQSPREIITNKPGDKTNPQESLQKSRIPTIPKSNTSLEVSKRIKSPPLAGKSTPNLENSKRFKSPIKSDRNNTTADDGRRTRSPINIEKNTKPKGEDIKRIKTPQKNPRYISEEIKIPKSTESFKTSEGYDENAPLSPTSFEESIRDPSPYTKYKNPDYPNKYIYENDSTSPNRKDKKKFQDFNDQDNLKKGKFMTGFEVSAMKNSDPQEIRISEYNKKNNLSPRRDIKDPDDKKKSDRNWTPDLDVDRFRGYTRPLLKEEKCWDSVSNFFGRNTPEDKSKDIADN